MKMMQIFDLLFKVISFIFEKLVLAGYRTCNTYFDEPEVPKELFETYQNN